VTLFRAMAWKNRTLKEARLALVLCILRGEGTVKELSRRFGVSRKTAYKWKARHESEGAGGLADRPPVARRIRRRLSAAWMGKLLRLHLRHPRWGPRKIRARAAARSRSGGTPSESTVKRWFARRGWVRRRPRRVMRGTPAVRPRLRKAGAPNAVWTVDFKGWFRTADGNRCDPLTLQDAHSRYLLRCQAVKRTDTGCVWPILDAAFREYGLPLRMRSDNGPPFATTAMGGLSKLAIRLIKAGVVPERIEPGKPQQNGRHERFHLTLKRETASPPAASGLAQQRRFNSFAKSYNEERPHEALGQTPPAQHYAVSPRRYSGRLREPDYPDNAEIRRVRHNGEIKWQGDTLYVGQVLCGEPVGCLPLDDGRWQLRYGPLDLGIIDASGRLHVLRRRRHNRPTS